METTGNSVQGASLTDEIIIKIVNTFLGTVNDKVRQNFNNKLQDINNTTLSNLFIQMSQSNPVINKFPKSIVTSAINRTIPYFRAAIDSGKIVISVDLPSLTPPNPIKTNYSLIINKLSTKALDGGGGDKPYQNPNVNVNNNWQNWKIVQGQSGYFLIVNKLSGMALDGGEGDKPYQNPNVNVNNNWQNWKIVQGQSG